MKKMQTGMDRYILVSKRKTSSRSPKQEPKPKIPRGNEQVSQNRFSILSNTVDDEQRPETVRELKPPPIYLREPTSNVLVNKLSQLIEKKNISML